MSASATPKANGPRAADSGKTLKRNSETWERDEFHAAQRKATATNIWGRLVSTNPAYANCDISKDTVVFGRSEECDVVISDPAVSSSHATLFREFPDDEGDGGDGGPPAPVLYVLDTSTNGTFIKNQRIGKGNKVRVTSGTEIVLIPQGRDRRKVSFLLYVPLEECQEEAPEGDVTFVFTDVQSSTPLWENCPEAMNEALRRHDKILRRLLKKFRGYEVKTEGDAFMVSFFNPVDAVRWCLAVQLALLECAWPDPLLEQRAAAAEKDAKGRPVFAGLRVRMGVHMGRPNCRRNPVTGRMDYFGPPVNRAARVSDAAHGGQVVVTAEVRDALEAATRARALEEVAVTSLGDHPFKGIAEPVRVFQVATGVLAARVFPPLRTAKAAAKPSHKLLPNDEKGAAAAAAAAASTDNLSDLADEAAAALVLANPARCANPACAHVESVANIFGSCARCKEVKYCSVECQRAHWKLHKPTCKPVARAPAAPTVSLDQ